MHDTLFSHITSFVPLQEKDKLYLSSYLDNVSFKKKEHLIVSGQKCRDIYFIAKGLCRLYLITEEGKEQTIQFGLENWWLTDYETFGKNQPSPFFIQALENTEILKMSYEQQEELLRKVPQLEKYFRIILQRAYAASLTRINLIFNLSKEEKYYHFREQFPQFIQRVPQKILSSYLGLTPEYLSEIRNKKE